MHRSRSKSLDADEDAIEKGLPKIVSKLQKSSINDTWNSDEVGLFHSMAPNTLIETTRCLEKKS